MCEFIADISHHRQVYEAQITHVQPITVRTLRIVMALHGVQTTIFVSNDRNSHRGHTLTIGTVVKLFDELSETY